MSKLTVPQHITNSTLFRNWLEAINGIIDEEVEIYDILEEKAPKYHATQSGAFGLGSPSVFGHVKLTDEVDPTIDSSQGFAVSPKGVNSVIVDFAARLDEIEERFFADLADLRTDMQEQIDSIVEDVAGKAPIYHASDLETYGKGNAVLYGHLKLSSERTSTLGVDEGTAATPSSVQTAYNDAVAYVDALDVDNRIESANRRIDQANEEIDALDDRMTAAESDIDDIQDKMTGLQIREYSESETVDSSKKMYGAYVCTGASQNTKLTLNACADNIKISVSNKSNYPTSVECGSGVTINGSTIPVVLGYGDSVSLIQAPETSSSIDWIITGRHSLLESAKEIPAASSVDVYMSSERAQIVDVNSVCSVNFILGSASIDGRTEYSEKTILFVAKTASARLSWPQTAQWMNSLEPPNWCGAAGDTLIVKAYQIGSRLFLDEMHNSHIVPSLPLDVVKLLS